GPRGGFGSGLADELALLPRLVRRQGRPAAAVRSFPARVPDAVRVRETQAVSLPHETVGRGPRGAPREPGGSLRNRPLGDDPVAGAVSPARAGVAAAVPLPRCCRRHSILMPAALTTWP